MDKKDIYKTIRISWMLSFIPVSLLAGPFGGYVLGNFLCARFGLKPYVLFISMAVGSLASIFETIRTIRSVFSQTFNPR